jgi:hypothetical protein
MRTETAVSTRIWLVSALCLGLCGGGAIGALMYALKTTSLSYGENLQGSARQENTARLHAVTFKKQVQEWKDIFLRGYNPEHLAQYYGQFRAATSDLSEMSSALLGSVTDPAARQVTGEFLHAQSVIRNRYEVTLGTLTAAIAGNGHETDQLARGQDRAVTVRIGKVVDALVQRAKAAIA